MATMDFDIYVWSAPRDLDADVAEALLKGWHDAGAKPGEAPFEPSTDVGWLYRELLDAAPELELASDARPTLSRTPIWLSTTDEPPARLVAIRVPPATPREALDAVFGLAAKYDLVLFDARSREIHHPLTDMADEASATFWPRGAIQAAVAGGVGAALAGIAWFLEIPLLSGVLVVVGGFMFVMAVFTFIHEARAAATIRRRSGG